jgi:HEXXH motif-containing protein
MAAGAHFVTSRQVRALGEGTGTLADLDALIAGEVSKCLTMVALIVRDAQARRHPEADVTMAGWRLLGRVQREAPGAVTELLRYPAVGAWASTLITGRAAAPGQLALIALAAAIRGGVRCRLTLPPSAVAAGGVHLPSLGTAAAHGEPGHITVCHHDGGTEISGPAGRLLLPSRLDRNAPGWRALATVSAGPRRGGLRLVIDDADPYRLPEHVRPAGELNPALRQQWRRRIGGGWRLLARDHPRTAAEITRLIRTVVPLSADGAGIRSLTTRQAFGSIGLTAADDDVQTALTLAHEVQHAKLAALMDLVPLVTESMSISAGYYVPWRPDPRPLASVLQGLYAHLGVARFWRRRRQTVSGAADAWQANVEFAKWRNSCAQVADSVRACPDLTSCGATFVAGMISVLRTWQNDSIPAAAEALADQEIYEHKKEWDARYRAGHDDAPIDSGPGGMYAAVDINRGVTDYSAT